MARRHRPEYEQESGAFLAWLEELLGPEVCAYASMVPPLAFENIDLFEWLTVDSLALAEMSLVLAALVRPGGPEMELFETDESDVIPAHDFLLPLPRLDSKGIRVRII